MIDATLAALRKELKDWRDLEQREYEQFGHCDYLRNYHHNQQEKVLRKIRQRVAEVTADDAPAGR